MSSLAFFFLQFKKIYFWHLELVILFTQLLVLPKPVLFVLQHPFIHPSSLGAAFQSPISSWQSPSSPLHHHLPVEEIVLSIVVISFLVEDPTGFFLFIGVSFPFIFVRNNILTTLKGLVMSHDQTAQCHLSKSCTMCLKLWNVMLLFTNCTMTKKTKNMMKVPALDLSWDHLRLEVGLVCPPTAEQQPFQNLMLVSLSWYTRWVQCWSTRRRYAASTSSATEL